MVKERFNHFDIISGVFIIQIIVMHILQFAGKYHNTIFSWVMHISFFFMPWFYFKSGYFHDDKVKLNIATLKKKSTKLLIPFAVCLFLGFLASFPFEYFISKRPLWRVLLSPLYSVLRFGSGGIGNSPLWFLLSLYFTYFIFSLITQFKIKHISILLPIVGFIMYVNKITLPLGLSNVFLSIFFYYSGNMYKIHIANNRYLTFIITFAAVFFLTSQILFFSNIDFRTNSLLCGYYYIYIISAFSGILIIITIAKRFQYNKVINHIGKNSLVYFTLHWPILYLVNTLYNIFDLEKSNNILIAATIICIFTSTTLANKLITNRFPKLLGITVIKQVN